MEESWLHPTSIALYFWVYMMIAGTIFQHRFYKYIKLNHYSIWEDVGCPTIWTDESLTSAWRTVRYMRDRLYSDLDDFEGIKYCDQKRVNLQLMFWGSAISLGIFIAFILFSGFPPAWK